MGRQEVVTMAAKNAVAKKGPKEVYREEKDKADARKGKRAMSQSDWEHFDRLKNAEAHKAAGDVSGLSEIVQEDGPNEDTVTLILEVTVPKVGTIGTKSSASRNAGAEFQKYLNDTSHIMFDGKLCSLTIALNQYVGKSTVGELEKRGSYLTVK
jgi:hypothetical protein